MPRRLRMPMRTLTLLGALLALLVLGCASPSGRPGGPRAPYLHPSARVWFPEELFTMRLSSIDGPDPRDVSAHYDVEGTRMSVIVYPAFLLDDPTVESHFMDALGAVGQLHGVTEAERHEIREPDDPRGAGLVATFVIDRTPPTLTAALGIFQACSHILKIRVTSQADLSRQDRVMLVVATAETVLPATFVTDALATFGPDVCETTIAESADGVTRVSEDGCVVELKADAAPVERTNALCDALDAKVRAFAP